MNAPPNSYEAGKAELLDAINTNGLDAFNLLINHARLKAAHIRRDSEVIDTVRRVGAAAGIPKKALWGRIRILEREAAAVPDNPDTWSFNKPPRTNGEDGDHPEDVLERISGALEQIEADILPPQDEPRQRKDQLVAVAASTIQPKRIEWLWPGRFALGKLAILGGFPDVGKSQLIIDIAARVSRGDAWPCDEGRAPQGNILLLCSEDDPADTVIPRLIAAGADLERVYIVPMVATKSGGEAVFSIQQHLPMLREKLAAIPQVLLVAIDPLSAHMGVGQVNTGRTSDVRGMLTPLVRVAQDKRLSIIGVMHFNKNQGVSNAMLRISDSLAFVAQARHCYVAVEDPEIEGRFLFVRAKNNLESRKRQALAYGISVKTVVTDPTGDIEAPYVEWDIKHVEGRAAELIEEALGSTAGRPGKLEAAADFLRAELAAGPLPSKELFDRAGKDGFSERTIRRAQERYRAEIQPSKTGPDGGWVWQLKGDAQ